MEENLIDPVESIPSIEELKKHPWICCGWGINTKKSFKNYKSQESVLLGNYIKTEPTIIICGHD